MYMDNTTNTETAAKAKTAHARRLAITDLESMRAFGDGSVTVCGSAFATSDDVYANDQRIASSLGLDVMRSLVTCEACQVALLKARAKKSWRR